MLKTLKQAETLESSQPNLSLELYSQLAGNKEISSFRVHQAKVALSCAILSGLGFFIGTLIATTLAFVLAQSMGIDKNDFPTPIFALILGIVLGASKGAGLGYYLFTSHRTFVISLSCAITYATGAFISSVIIHPGTLADFKMPEPTIVILISIIVGTLLGLGYSVSFDDGESKFMAVISGLSGTLLASLFSIILGGRFASDSTLCTLVISSAFAISGLFEGFMLSYGDKFRMQIASLSRLGSARILGSLGRVEDAQQILSQLEKTDIPAIEKLAKATKNAILGDYSTALALISETEKMPDNAKGIDPLLLKSTIALTGVFTTSKSKRAYPQPQLQSRQTAYSKPAQSQPHPQSQPQSSTQVQLAPELTKPPTTQSMQSQPIQAKMGSKPIPSSIAPSVPTSVPTPKIPIIPQEKTNVPTQTQNIPTITEKEIPPRQPAQPHPQFDKFVAHFERTKKMIEDCKRKIDDAKRAGFNVAPCIPIIKEAQKAFEEGDYKRARELTEVCEKELDKNTNLRHQVIEKLNVVKAKAEDAKAIGANIKRVLEAINGVEYDFANENYENCLNGIIRAADEIRLAVKVVVPQFIRTAENDAEKCEKMGIEVSGLRAAIKEVEDAFACNDYGAVLSFATSCNKERMRILKLASELKNCGSCGEEIPEDLEHVKCKCGKKYHIGCAQRNGECVVCLSKLEIPASALAEAYKCFVCGGMIKPGLVVITCRCGKGYHDFCAKRVSVCPNCGADLTINPKPKSE